jgi:hypothetical protein
VPYTTLELTAGRFRCLFAIMSINSDMFGDYSIFTGFWYGSRGAFIVECWPPHMITEDKAMFGPGAYRPDPTEGMTAMADLPPPEIVPSNRTYPRQACPRCGHQA